MPVTLKDIAAATGVSIGTVERALKNRDRINPEVAARIREIAKEMNYRPNRIASGLVNRTKNYRIAVVLHTRNDFMDGVLAGIRQAAKEIKDYGISVEEYIGNSFDADRQVALIDQALEEGATALVVVPINSPKVADAIRHLTEQEFPVVFLVNYLADLPVFSSIHCDYRRSGRMAAGLLCRLSSPEGQTAVFLPPALMLGHQQRRHGILRYFLEDTPCTLTGNRLSLSMENVYELTGTAEEDLALIRNVFSVNPQIRHVIYNGDTGTYLKALREHGVLSEQSAAAGAARFTSIVFDTSPVARQALLDGEVDAIIVQSQKDQGYRAIDVLLQFFTAGKRPAPKILFPSEILIRESLDDEE